MSVAKKILAVMSEIDGVKKDKRNEFHKYTYASDEAVVTEIRAAMIKNGLIVVPNQLSCRRDVVKTDRGESGITEVLIEYKLVDTDTGESETARCYGQGQDSGDKGVYKAATGAEKYFLLKTFLIPTGDDPEADGKLAKRSTPLLPVIKARIVAEEMANDAIEPIGERESSWPHPAEQGMAEPSHFPKRQPFVQKPNCISEKQAKRFYAIAKTAGKTDEDIKAFLRETIGSEHSRDIPWRQYEDICNWGQNVPVEQ